MIRFDIVSGFLGAGKTTFINLMMGYFQKTNQKTVFIVNEFGEKGIDTALIKQGEYEVLEIKNGCICCSLRFDFIHSLYKIIADLKPDRIVFEPSGIFILSELFELLKSFTDDISVGSIITVIDAVNYTRFLNKNNYYIDNQIMQANTLVISKAQNNPEFIEELVCELISKNSKAKILAMPWDDIQDEDLKELLEKPAISVNKSRMNALKIHLNSKFATLKGHSTWDTLGVELKDSIDIGEFMDAIRILLSGKCGQIIRVKGFFKSDDKTFVFHGVGNELTSTEIIGIDNYCMAIIGEQIERQSVCDLLDTFAITR